MGGSSSTRACCTDSARVSQIHFGCMRRTTRCFRCQSRMSRRLAFRCSSRWEMLRIARCGGCRSQEYSSTCTDCLEHRSGIDPPRTLLYCTCSCGTAPISFRSPIHKRWRTNRCRGTLLSRLKEHKLRWVSPPRCPAPCPWSSSFFPRTAPCGRTTRWMHGSTPLVDPSRQRRRER